MAGRWFPPGMMVSSTNKTDRHDITEMLLSTITRSPCFYSILVLGFSCDPGTYEVLLLEYLLASLLNFYTFSILLSVNGKADGKFVYRMFHEKR